MPKVNVYTTSYRTIQETIDEIFASFQVDVRGKRVLIKPNALSEREPEMAANTHPSIIRAVVNAVKEAGAAETMVADNPGQANYGTMRSLFATNGLGEAAGDSLRNFGINLTERQIPSLPDVGLYFPELLFEADYIINMPKLKVHPNTGLTASIKNCFGYLAGAQKAFCHEAAENRRHFEMILADIYRLRKPDLNIVDAILIAEGRAKGGTNLRYLGKVLASTSAPAADVLGATILGLDPTNLYHLTYVAEDEGIPLDAEQLDVYGEWQIIPDILKPFGFNPGETRSTKSSSPGLLESATQKKFILDHDACTSCGVCVEECPTGALSMGADNYPTSNEDKCVACFACMEVCEPAAIRLESLCPANG